MEEIKKKIIWLVDMLTYFDCKRIVIKIRYREREREREIERERERGGGGGWGGLSGEVLGTMKGESGSLRGRGAGVILYK